MVFHDREHLGQTQPCARSLGGDEGVEDAVNDFRLDTLTRVADADHRDGTLFVSLPARNGECQSASGGHGIDGIEDQVETGLGQLPRVGIHRGARRTFIDHGLDVVSLQFRRTEPQHVLEQLTGGQC